MRKASFGSRRVLRAALLTCFAAPFAACSSLQRLSEIGSPPAETKIEDPTKAPGYKPVSLPMPAPVEPEPGPNSLWRPGARAFLKDQRASEVGDIVTVAVNTADSADLKNDTSSVGANTDVATPNSTLLGFETKLSSVLPKAASAANLFDVGSTSTVSGTGTVSRHENVVINMAAEVTQKLPNGNLVIKGRQELRINSELRELTVEGIIRPEDVASSNTISSSQIAEARIIYGGRGTLSDVQTARPGQQLLDILWPF
jgi:flagellar L-ring protein precursor FlgH